MDDPLSSAQADDKIFRLSCGVPESYPQNLLLPYGCLSELEDCRERLDQAEPQLFNQDSQSIRVAFREIDALGQVTKQNIFNQVELDKWLQCHEDYNAGLEALKEIGRLPKGKYREPKCRFIFLLSGNSRDPLNITRDMFNTILSYHQVSQSFVQFVLSFGYVNRRATNHRHSGFQSHSFVNKPVEGLRIPSKGWSGHHYQMSYNLRALEPSGGFGNLLNRKPYWAKRQIAIHHQFDVVYGTSVWIVASGQDTIKRRIQKLTAGGEGGWGSDILPVFGTKGECLMASLAVHREICQWASKEWRWYMKWLEEKFEDEVSEPSPSCGLLDMKKLMAQQTEAVIEIDKVALSEVQLRDLQSCEDHLREAIMVLRTNGDVVDSIRSFYEGLRSKQTGEWGLGPCNDSIYHFSSHLENATRGMKMQTARGEVLLKLIADRKALMQYRMQAKFNAELAEITIRMQAMTETSQKEAVAVRIIAFITLLYLPATFVSAFFSTGVVRYDQEGQIFSSVGMRLWIEVTLPLTLLTLLAVAFWNTGNDTEEGILARIIAHVRVVIRERIDQSKNAQ